MRKTLAGTITSEFQGLHAACRHSLIEENLNMVVAMARSIKRRLPDCFVLDDLISAGNIGLVSAAARYEPEAHDGVRFQVFARQRIRGAIIDSISGSQYEQATRPGLAEVVRDPIALSAVEEVIDAERLRKRVGAAIAKLKPRERWILGEYYSQSQPTMREMAVKLGVSNGRIWQIHREAIAALRDLLRAA